MENDQTTYEADNQTGKNHEGNQPNVPLRRLTASTIIGTSVENNDGEELGKVKDLMINLNAGGIEYAILEAGSFLGIGGKLFAIPYNELTVDPLREIFILNKDKEYVKNAPGFDKDHWPETNDHESYYTDYYSNVGSYWVQAPIASPAPGSPLSAYY